MSDSTERERMVAGRTYRSTDPELTAMRAATKRVLHEYNTTHPDDEEHRAELLQGLLGSVGQVWIEPPFRCDYGAQITMGNMVFANYDLTVLDCAPVTIGDAVLIGPRVTLATASHPIDFEQREGRVDRYDGHAVRLNIAARHAAAILASHDPDPWRVAYELAQDEADTLGEFAPHWVYPGDARIERHVAPFPLSIDEARLADIKRDVALYRLTFGQPRQEDMLELLRRHYSTATTEQLEALRLDLAAPSVVISGRADLAQ